MTDEPRAVAGAQPAPSELQQAKALDWVGTVGPVIADLIGGRAAIALRGLLRLRTEYRRRSQDGTTEESGPEVTPTSLPASELEDEVATEFVLTLGEAWRRKGGDLEFADYVRDLAIAVWANSTAYRDVLGSVAWEPDDIRILCRDAGLDMSRLVLQGNAERQWFSVFEYLRTQPEGQLLFLLFLASRRHPAEDRLRPWT